MLSYRRTAWYQFSDQLHKLKNIEIPRYYFSDIPMQIYLLGFCDASSAAFGACLYPKATCNNTKPTCVLVTAKSKVAPIKKQQTIPRLELNGANLLAKLVKRFLEATSHKIKIYEICLFTDSSIVLSWIKSPYKHKHDTYVSHRLTQVIDLTQSDTWHYCDTKSNPADVITRGTTPDSLLSCILYWNGPTWILQPQSNWPTLQTQTQTSTQSDLEHITITTCHIIKATDADLQKDTPLFYNIFCKHSNFTRLTRTVAYVLRFSHNLKNKNEKLAKHLSVSELRHAHNFIIRQTQMHSFAREIKEIQSTLTQVREGTAELTQIDVGTTQRTTQGTSTPNSRTKQQKLYTYTSSPLRKLNPFLDNDNILRVGGRIKHSDIPYTQAHPIILPAKDNVTSIIVNHYHLKLFHSGIQSTLYNIRLKYWPINGRNEVKKCIHACVTCIRFRGTVCRQQMADLPAPRVTHSRIFSHVGIDYSGAIAIRSSMTRNCKYTKGYIALFIDLPTRAISLELVGDMSSKSFICAFKRFISRRGYPVCLYTDNCSNFRGSKTELHELYKMFKNDKCYSDILDYCTTHAIDYKFTVPLASHMGGIYEAGIKCTKSLLKRHLCNTKLTYEFLYTVLSQVEAILNSRPLYPITDLPNDVTCLTPGHFIIGTAMTELPEPNLLDLNESRLDMYRRVIQLKQRFWKQFYFSYLSELQNRNKWLQAECNIKIGDLVIIKDEATPPLFWPLGRVIGTNVNKTDGLVRSVDVRTSKSQYTRPIHKLILLPSKN